MSRIIASCMLFISSVLLPATVFANENAYALFREGMAFESSLSMYQARDKFREAITIDSANAGYLEHYAWFLHFNGFPEEAVAVFNAATVLKPADRDLKMGKAWNLRVTGRLRESLEIYSKLLPMKTAPDDVAAASAEVRQLLAAADDAKIALMRERLAQSPGDREAALELFRTLAYRGRFAESLATGDSILARSPNDLTFRLEYARVLSWSGRREESADCYHDLMSKSPDNSFLMFELAAVLADAGRLDESLKLIERARELGPKSARLEELEYSIHKALAPRIAGMFQYYGNSSRFERFNAGLSGETRVGRELSLLADASLSRFSQTGYRGFSREALAVGVRYTPLPKLEFSGRAGGNIYDRGDDSATGAAGMTARLYPGWHLAVAWERLDIIDTEPVFGNAIYNHVVTMGAVGSRINSNEYSIYLQRDLLAGRLALSGKATVGDYSDGNLKQSRFAGISYRLLNAPSLTLGYQYFFLNYRDAAPSYTEGVRSTSAYYDPLNFEVHTLFLDVSHRFSKSVRGGVEQRVSFIPKSDGTAYAVFALLEADLGRSVSARLTYRFFHQNRGVDRTGTSGYFSAQEALAGITVYF